MLYICATPIGNLEDITLRVLSILRTVDLIACEDTRHTQKLLNHFEITSKTTSLHEHNEMEKSAFLIDEMKKGKTIALVSDAGMPAISDPGAYLIRATIEAGIKVSVAPGATALIAGLAVSGLSTKRFTFYGFLSKQNKTRKHELQALEKMTTTIILYESPHQLKQTLEDLFLQLGNRQMSIIRELTKKFEEIRLDTIENHQAYYENNAPRGEFVLVIEGNNPALLQEAEQDKWSQISITEHVALYIADGITEKDAMKQVASDRGLGNRDVYHAYKIL